MWQSVKVFLISKHSVS